MKRKLVCFLVGLALTLPSRAAITVVSYWRLGEDTSGASDGGAANSATDSVGTHNMSFVGNAAFSSDVSATASNSLGSRLSVSFSGGYAAGGTVSSAQDNFGIEGWVKPSSVVGANQIIAYNGSTTNSGWGIFIDGSRSGYAGLLGGVDVAGDDLNSATPNVWTHVALVRDNGVATLYVNGRAASYVSTAKPGAPSHFALGTDPQALGQETFSGLMDEVRVFTFALGQFTTNDLFTSPPHPAVVITNAADSGPGTLRNALSAAVYDDNFIFDPSLSGRTIFLTNGQLALNTRLTIDASSLPGGIQLNGLNSTRAFNNVAIATLNSLTITNGYAADDIGGAIFNGGALTLNQVTLIKNGADGYGGAIENDGTLTLHNCSIVNNFSLGGGGGIDNNAQLVATQCTFFGNISTNSGDGGAVWAGGTNTFVNCTIVGNTGAAGNTGGIAQYGDAPMMFTNCIAALNTNGDISDGFIGANNLTGIDPMLAPLGSYGGLTPTMPPLPGSPAVDAGNDFVTNFLAADQRGLPRLTGDHVDIGAVELQLTAGVPPIHLTSAALLGAGYFRFTFTNVTGASFRVLATTNLALPVSQWTPAGFAVEPVPGSGHFEFTDPEGINNQRFYRVRTP